MTTLRFQLSGGAAADLLGPAGTVLLHYVLRSAAGETESPRPYAHPVRSLAGETLTNLRPNDHPWHHGLSFTINNLDGWNFWGGPTYRRGEGYRLRVDHGAQHHVECVLEASGVLLHRIEWRARGAVLLREERRLAAEMVSPQAWSLRWQASLRNVAGRPLTCANYHSGEGLAGSHYTGLQFRGARDLLDEHGDAAVGVFAEGDRAGEAAVHGAAARWMEWRGQKDLSLRRVRIRFGNAGPLHWFVRAKNPLAAFPFHFDRNLILGADQALEIDHTLTFSDS